MSVSDLIVKTVFICFILSIIFLSSCREQSPNFIHRLNSSQIFPNKVEVKKTETPDSSTSSDDATFENKNFENNSNSKVSYGRLPYGTTGDFWGTVSYIPEDISFRNENMMYPVRLWRSSYGDIAPMYDQYGNPLYLECPDCPRPKYYHRYSNIAAYLDRGLYDFERNIISRNEANRYFSAPTLLTMCSHDNVLSRAIKTFTSSAGSLSIPNFKDAVYNIIDHVNYKRYGCPRYDRVEVCYGRRRQ